MTRANRDDLDLVDPEFSVQSSRHLPENGTLVTLLTNTYTFRAYIETLLSYGPDAKDTQLTGQLWHKDTATRMDAVEIVDETAANAWFVTRRANIVRSRTVDLMGRLHVDLFLQDKFLINGVDAKIRLVRSKPAFVLMAGGANPDYRINIVNATLFAKKATLNPTVQMAHIKVLEKRTVKYPMRSVECKVYSIPAGARSHTHENLFLGTLPKRLVLCCIDNDAYNGAYDKKTPDQCDGPCFHQVQKGNLRIELHFRDALLNTVNVISLRRVRVRVGNRQEPQHHLRLLRWTRTIPCCVGFSCPLVPLIVDNDPIHNWCVWVTPSGFTANVYRLGLRQLGLAPVNRDYGLG